MICPDCFEDNTDQPISEWSGQIKCKTCGRVFSVGDITFGVKGFKKDATAFGYDEKGRMVGIDNNGKRFDPKDSRYDFRGDKHGWKTNGKKVRGENTIKV